MKCDICENTVDDVATICSTCGAKYNIKLEPRHYFIWVVLNGLVIQAFTLFNIQIEGIWIVIVYAGVLMGNAILVKKVIFKPRWISNSNFVGG